MDQNINNQTTVNTGGMGMQENLPNAVTTLVLGIISIATCWCYGVVGAVLGIIGLVLAKKDNELLQADPTRYSESSKNNSKAGKICSIIGLALSGVYVLFLIIYIVIYGAAVLMTAPWDYRF